MAALANNVPTVVDVTSRLAPDGSMDEIAELLSQSNPIIDDVPQYPANLPTGHRSTIRINLPTVSVRRFNKGVQSSKSVTAQVTDSISMMEAWSTVDVDELKLNGNGLDFRMSEASAFIEAMGQRYAQMLFTGNEGVTPEEFSGFQARYPTLGTNVLSAGGAGTDNQDCWLVGWGKGKVHGVYPAGSVAGLQHIDRGIQTEQTPQVSAVTPGLEKMLVYEDVWKWHAGLVVKDWRYVVRIANLDVSDMAAQATTQLVKTTVTADTGNVYLATNLVPLMVRATYRIPNLAACNPVFYLSRSAAECLHLAALSRTIPQLTIDTIGGKPITRLLGIPIKVCDQIVTYATPIV